MSARSASIVGVLATGAADCWADKAGDGKAGKGKKGKKGGGKGGNKPRDVASMEVSDQWAEDADEYDASVLP